MFPGARHKAQDSTALTKNRKKKLKRKAKKAQEKEGNTAESGGSPTGMAANREEAPETSEADVSLEEGESEPGRHSVR